MAGAGCSGRSLISRLSDDADSLTAVTTSDEGLLILAGTPIGGSNQASDQLRETLRDADVIAAEDTRLFRTLLARIDVTTRAHIVSYFEGMSPNARPGCSATCRPERPWSWPPMPVCPPSPTPASAW